MSEVTKLVAELEYRAEIAEAELDRAYERYDQAEKDRNRWHDKAQEYKRRCELYEEQEMGVAAACCDREMALPRVITADELRRGQKIAVFDHEESSIGVVASSSKYSIDFTNYGGWSVSPEEMPTIVLLADAPEKKHDLPGLTRVDYMDGSYEYFCTAEYAAEHAKSVQWDNVAPWRGTPVTPQSIRTGDVYDIHTAHGSVITGVLAGRDGVHRTQNGDHYRMVRKAHA